MDEQKEINTIAKKTLRNDYFGYAIVNEKEKHASRFARTYFHEKKITVIEIGTLDGKNAENILKGCNVEKIYLIDPYVNYDSYDNKGNLSNEEMRAKKRLKKYGDKVIFIKKFSEEAINDVPEADFIYIDGNHEYSYFKKDFEMYYKKLKKGGLFAGDNITTPSCSRDIFRVLAEFSVKNKIYPNITRTDWYFIKND